MRIILLTKTPQSARTRLCLQLLAGLAGSVDVIVYLAGDGVYNLLGQGGPYADCQTANQMVKPLLALLPRDQIMACREDLAARGVCADGKAMVPANFYELLVDGMMKEGSRIYTF
jgi:sulfur relay (sulfurtransferase) DsrF/TusC family protein